MLRISVIVLFCLLNQAVMANIVKSPIDNKEYRYVQLENNLKVLLIHDSDAEVSAASLNVAIGSAMNPDEWPGLAHFLEHMLFLGSKKYPIVGQYSQFIKTNGGSMNAYTSQHNTNYYFSINTSKLEPALDRFSRFFIDPTFNPDFVERERHVVHSEYESRRKGEGMRIYSAGQELMNQAHPLSRFTIGTVDTLADKENQTAREALISFYEKYYSANLMSLVVVSSEPLDKVEKWVKQKFTEIPDKQVERPIFDVPYFNPKSEHRLLLIKPEKDTYQLQYQFPMPSTFDEYASKPGHVLASVIGDESEGSLLALLREKGYATSLSAGMSYVDPVQSVFNIRIGLTKLGDKHIDEIHRLVFATIQLAEKGIEKWRYDEARQLAKLKFRFKQEQKSIKLASQLSALMQDIPVEDVLQVHYMYTEFDEKRSRELWQFLNADNVYITRVSPNVKTDNVSQYFDVEFALKAIDAEQMKSWKSVKSDKSLSLPAKNPFIAERLDLIEHASKTDYPQQLEYEKNIDIWYQADTDFKSPRANFYVALMSPDAITDVKKTVMMSHWLQIVRNRLNKETYSASLASLNYELYSHLRGISLRIGGFEDKQTELLSLILNEIANTDFTQEEFDTFKQELLRKWRNFDKESVQKQIFEAFWLNMVETSYSNQEKIAALEKLTIKDLQNWHKAFFSNVYVRILSHGDISAEVTKQRVSLIKAWLRDSELVNKPSLPQPRQLAKDQLLIENIDIDHNDSALLLYYQSAVNDINQRAKISLLSNLLSSDYYNHLRTQNRVGYIVYATSYSVIEHPGLMFFSQSPTHGPSALYDLSLEFFAQFKDTLANYDEQQFEQVKQGLMSNINAPDDTLSARSGRLWRDLDREQFGFAYRDKLLESLEALTLEDMRAFYEQMILENQRKLLLQTVGQNVEHGGLIENKTDADENEQVSLNEG